MLDDFKQQTRTENDRSLNVHTVAMLAKCFPQGQEIYPIMITQLPVDGIYRK